MSSPAYSFETPAAFLNDFGAVAAVGAQETDVILSQPGQDLLGGRIESTQYEIRYVTSQLTLAHGTKVAVTLTLWPGGTKQVLNFTTLQTYPLDDGIFSRARLQS